MPAPAGLASRAWALAGAGFAGHWSTMETSLLQSFKLALVSFTGLSRDTLHVYVGLALFLAVASVLRRPLGSWGPGLAVVAAALAGEALDLRDDLASLGYWRWTASLHDVLNTIAWPGVITLLARAGLLRG